MKIIESDRRYKHHHSGFKYILHFKTTLEDRQKYQKVLTAVESVYGPYISYDWHESNSFTYQRFNDNFKTDYSRKQKYRRIYFKNQKDLTFFLLKGNV